MKRGMKRDYIEKLYELQDEKYREFQSKLIPSIDSNTMIGVRTPELRKLAKSLAKEEDVEEFFDEDLDKETEE